MARKEDGSKSAMVDVVSEMAVEFDNARVKKKRKGLKGKMTKVDEVNMSSSPTRDSEICDSLAHNQILETLRPAWVDDDLVNHKVDISKVKRLKQLRKVENETEVDIEDFETRLRAQFTKLNPPPNWVNCDSQNRIYEGDSSDDEANGGCAPLDDIFRRNEDLVVKAQKLLPGILGYSRAVDANVHGPSSPPITSTQFHPNGRLLVVAGPRCGMGFYDIDGKHNTNIEAFHDKGFPIQKASFLPDGSRALITGRKSYFCVFDLESANVSKAGPLVGRDEKSLENFAVSPSSDLIAFIGNHGYVLLVSSKSLELIGTLKMNGTACSLAFSNDGSQLFSHGGDGQIYAWDLRTRTCTFKGADDGCLTGTALCTSPVGTVFASGSDSGIVNVYNKDDFLAGKKKPMKTIENLTTKVDFMKFNHDAQLLAICSYGNKNSLKLVHVPSYTVYSNWPPPGMSLKPSCMDFSPSSGFLSVGDSGKVLLYRLHHYDRT